ncbi:MAG TPA: hypothetical protein VM840_09805 [Actinomycetota bacterium]|nr:hypothetical protein [Actinomycetota bacterium]
MNDERQVWEQVGERFSQVGRRLKEHYDREAAEVGAAESRQVEDALRTLADAVGQAFDAVGTAVRDEGFRREVASAVQTLTEALSATFDQVGGEIRERVANRRTDDEQQP